MFAYRTPGVRFEWRDVEASAAALARGDIAGFVGITARGPLHTPVKVRSWDQFARLFGGHLPQAFLAYAVEGFFANGGRACYVVRVADPDLALPATLDLADRQGLPALRLVAASPGAWGRQLQVAVPVSGSDGSFDLALTLPDGTREAWHDLTIYPASVSLPDQQERPALRLLARARGLWLPYLPPAPPAAGQWPGRAPTLVAQVWPGGAGMALTLELRVGEQVALAETYLNLSLAPEHERYAVRVLNDRSSLVAALALQGGAGPPPQLASGAFALAPAPRFVARLLNDPASGSLLAQALPPPELPARAPAPTPGRWLAGGQDGLAPALTLSDALGRPRLRLIACSPDRPVDVELVRTSEAEPGCTLRIYCGAATPRETFAGLSLLEPLPDALRDPVGTINDPLTGSRLVTAVALPPAAGEPSELAPRNRARLSGGLAAIHLTGADDPATPRWGLRALELAGEVSIVALPDAVPALYAPAPALAEPPIPCSQLVAPGSPAPPIERAPELAPPLDADATRAIQQHLAARCAALGDRMALLDPRPEHSQPEQLIAWRGGFDTSYAALYFPWLLVPDPLRSDGQLRAVPPCGHVAGVYARVERQAGVHWPPANQELSQALDIAAAAPACPLVIDDLAHGDLNDQQINVIRAYPGRGLRIAGARTLSSDRRWRFVNVRRLITMIVETLERRTRWTVFEPNSPQLQRDIARVVRSMLDEIWRRGMLDGARPDQAYRVTCDASTNPPDVVERGMVVCQIELLPPEPAEFVVVRIGRSQSGVTILEAAEAGYERKR